MNFWEIGYLIFTCLTWFLLFGLIIKGGQGAPSSVKIVALKDVPALLAEVDRLRAQLDSRARSEAQLVNAFESLIQDTDGGEIDGDAEIPIGEIRRVFHEATAVVRSYPSDDCANSTCDIHGNEEGPAKPKASRSLCSLHGSDCRGAATGRGCPGLTLLSSMPGLAKGKA